MAVELHGRKEKRLKEVDADRRACIQGGVQEDRVAFWAHMLSQLLPELHTLVLHKCSTQTPSFSSSLIHMA